MAMVSLIVMEPGSAWPGPIEDVDHVVAIGPEAEALLDRTRHIVDNVLERREGVHVAVLACNDSTDVVSTSRRAEIAYELLSAVAAAPRGRLLLCAADRSSKQLRHELMCLAGRLSHSTQGRAATVSLRFGGATDEVGLWS